MTKAGSDKLNKISQPVEENERGYRSFNSSTLMTNNGSKNWAVASSTSGFPENKDLRLRLKEKTTTLQLLRSRG
jgi:hypothetical protein